MIANILNGRSLSLILPLLVLVQSASGGVRISEFMAENNGFFFDQDGDSPDWIELRNEGDTIVNLAGWHLTDTPTNLTQWTFPSTPLAPGALLLVFASGKDRAVAGAELHTNFQLDSAGEYLALVEPDGQTIVQAYIPNYPPQRANISYGTERQVTVTPLIETGAAGRLLVPVDGTLTTSWTQSGFDDAAWSSATTGIGFDAAGGGSSGGALGTVVLSVDFNDDDSGEAGAANTEAGFDTMNLSANPSTFNGISVSLAAIGGATLDDRDRAVPVDSLPALTQDQLYDDFIFASGTVDGNGLSIRMTGLTPNQDYYLTIWSYDNSSTGSRVSDWIETASSTTTVIATAYNFDGSIVPTQDGHDTFGNLVRSSPEGVLQIEGRRHGGTSHGVFLNALQLVQVGYGSLIDTDTGAAMLNQNASAYLRLPFNVENPAAWQSLSLRMKYDDGFVAYLNGQEVASRNAPASPQWNSSATAAHPNAEALVFEEISLANAPGLLQSGANVLAIHGLNAGAADGDFLIVPELVGVNVDESAGLYLKPPTPGQPNGPGFPGFVGDTKFSVDRGFFEVPFTVAITSATPAAVIRWTTDGSPPTESTGTIYTGPITITNTTYLRAAAFKSGLIPSDVDTHTYLFLDNVIRQPNDQPGFPTIWQGSYPADYGMDPTVVDSPNYGVTIKQDLRSIPTLSIVTTHNNLWHPSSGIYNNATSEGTSWERAASVELIDGDGTTEFAVNCGIQMQGNASRDNARTPKHSVRLLFKSIYGPSKLRYDWFPGPVDKFNTIVLRACFTDSWSSRYSDSTTIPGGRGTRYRPEDSLLLRDVWVKDCMADMGWLSGRGDFVHLYLNGLYWGVYNSSERLDGTYFEEHVGGREEDWDVIRDFSEVLTGSKSDWDQMMALVNAGITSEAAYQAVEDLVEIDNLIDFMMLHIFAEAEDWPHHNWYAAHRRAGHGLPATKWVFLSWDQEIVLDQLVRRNRIDVNNNDTPARIYSQLRAYPEFRRRFGDRLQKHLFNGGALTPENNIARLQSRVSRVNRAMVGESARWGDAREFAIGANPATGQTFTRDEWWIPEIEKLYNDFFQHLNSDNIARFRAGGLYPAIDAPEFNQFGGTVSPGFELVMSHPQQPTGSIFYTLDGSDPREYGTALVSPNALAYADPLPILAPTRVRARVFLNNEWSALIEADFFPPQDFRALAFTEIMYNPPGDNGFTSDDLEFLELKNTGGDVLDLTGLSFSQGVNFVFPEGTLLGSGEFFVLGRNDTALTTRYPGLTVNGVYTGQLDNGGETVTLVHPAGPKILSVDYNDEGRWPITPDGYGFSLVPRNPGMAGDSASPVHWRASRDVGGSPGADDPETTIADILINEILTHTDPPLQDYIELYNPSAEDVDLGGWYLTDARQTPRKFRISPGTMIAARGYRTFTESDFNPTPGQGNSFTLSSLGEEVYLFSAESGGTNFTGYTDGFNFGAAANGVSFGRYVTSTGEEHYPAQTVLSSNLPNAGPLVGPVVISQIMYHPPDLAFGVDNTADEFVELSNIGTSPVPLFDAFGNTWQLRDAIDFVFPANVILPPGGRLLVVSFNPDSPSERAAFEATYPMLAGVPKYGPFQGKLDNSEERVELVRPDTPNLDLVPEIIVERVHYLDRAPWPVAADGTGASLQRVSMTAYGNDPVNWQAIAALSLLAQPQGLTVDPGANVSLVVVATGTEPLHYQWQFNGIDIPGANADALSLMNVQEADEGVYTVVVSDVTGSIVSQPAFVGVLIDPYVIQRPLSQTVVEGGNVTLSIEAGGHLPMGFRWRKGSLTLANEYIFSHTSFYTIQNAQLSDAGNYTIVLTNAALPVPGVLSPSASITVLTDTDHDGLPDVYETAQGLNPEDPTDAQLDADEDGSSNTDEYIAGTDARDLNSYLKVEEISVDSGLLRLEFLAVSNRTYTLLRTESLEAPDWVRIRDFAAGPTNRVLQVMEAVTPGLGRYYRLATPRIPELP